MEKSEFIYEAELLRVIDGDTVEFLVDVGFDMFTKQKFRLLAIDTPEVFGVKKGSEEYALGKLASAFTANWFVENGSHVVIQSFSAQRELRTGKYGRWLAYIYPQGESTEHLNGALLAAGHVKK